MTLCRLVWLVLTSHERAVFGGDWASGRTCLVVEIWRSVGVMASPAGRAPTVTHDYPLGVVIMVN